MISSAIIAVTEWDGSKIKAGTISLVFTEGLYSNTQSGTEQTTLPVDGCKLLEKDHDATTYAALGSIITTTQNSGVTVHYATSHADAVSRAPISVIELDVANVQNGFGISFANTVCDKKGNGLNRTPSPSP